MNTDKRDGVGFFEGLRNRWYAFRLAEQKRRARFELGCDAAYIMAFKSEALNRDEAKDRKRMAELKAKETPTESEAHELEVVTARIAESKAVKQEYRRTVQVLGDVENYLSIL